MKKILSSIISLGMCVSMLAGCSGTETTGGNNANSLAPTNSVATEDALKVVATIYPLYDWASEVANGQDVDLTLLIGNGVDLHSYQPTFDDFKAIKDADVVIYLGSASDSWVEDALTDATNPDMIVINAMEVLGTDNLIESEHACDHDHSTESSTTELSAEEHVHDEDCTDSCCEEEHVHTDDCCEEEHVHTDDCCEEEHVHDEDCTDSCCEEASTAELSEEHVHDEDCTDSCCEEEHVHEEEEHVHDEDCTDSCCEEASTTELSEEHTHDEEEHVHDEDCTDDCCAEEEHVHTDDCCEEEEHVHTDDCCDHEHGVDEHIWLSLDNAIIVTQHIANVFAQADSESKSAYETNSTNYIAQLAELDAQYTAVVESATYNTLLFADRFPFLYFVECYGLEYYAAFESCTAETEVSFETLTTLTEVLNELALPVVLTIENPQHNIAATVVASSNHKDTPILVLHSIQSVTNAEINSGLTYLSLMQDNLDVLTQALN